MFCLLYSSVYSSLYFHHDKIYTDGSKTDSGVEHVAIVTNETKITQNLTSSSIFTAEAYAILEALQYAHSNNEARVVTYVHRLYERDKSPNETARSEKGINHTGVTLRST